MKLDDVAGKLIHASVASNEVVVIVYDNSTRLVAQAMFQAAQKKSSQVSLFNVDEFSSRPIPRMIPEIETAVQHADILFMLLKKYANDQYNEHITFRKPLIHIKENGRLRVGALYDVDEEQFCKIFSYDPKDVQELNQKLHRLITKASRIKITTPAGTDMSFVLSPDLVWINQDADLSEPSPQHSLLAGEVYGCPLTGSGTMVVDGIMGGQFMKYGTLEKTPITITVEDGRMTAISGEHETLVQELKAHMQKFENADRIGEIGFGTNTSLRAFYGVLGIDEKFPGNHIAFGHSYAEKTGATWSCPVHVDMVMRDCSTWIDDVQVLKDGKYLV